MRARSERAAKVARWERRVGVALLLALLVEAAEQRREEETSDDSHDA